MKRILIILLSPRRSYLTAEPDYPDVDRRKYFESIKDPDTEVDVRFPTEKETSGLGLKYHTGYDVANLGPYVVKACVEAESKGFTAALVHATYDPGVEAARHVVDIPVLGPGRVGVFTAAMLVQRFAIIVYAKSIIPYIRDYINWMGAEKHVTSITSLDVPPGETKKHTAEIKQKWGELSRKAVDEGAQLILPFAGILIPVHFSAEEFQRETGVPVLDPYWVTFKLCEGLSAMKIPNLRTAYPTPSNIESIKASFLASTEH
jgi:allantoin racemase